MESTHILLVEDEPFLAKVIKDSLEQRSYQVSLVGDGRNAFRLFGQELFSLCIVDVMLPQLDGFTLVKQIRTLNSQVPVLFLTARVADKDVIEGYSSGGNDYLKKPFSLDELFLRVNELLRRNINPVPAAETTLPIGQYQFVPHTQMLLFPNQKNIRLSHRETQLLQLLYGHRNQVLARKQVLLMLWGDDTIYNARTMDVFITKLRKHLRADRSVEIVNLRGVGYKLIC
ncbi:response regulator transcription factor [Spirosoma agri]|uniref:Response regulator transcription factor n=2 Tax=Spirosoma agri TaxID=1987381 RepID=A0A6M0IQZ7_9BACT|nr:response regulator transcription factor [Spirosoma agri]